MRIVCRLIGLSVVVFALSVLIGGLLPEGLAQAFHRGGPLRPLGATIVLLFGLVLVLSDPRSQSLRRIRMALGSLALLFALAGLFESLVHLPYGLHTLVAPRWMTGAGENLRLPGYAASGFAMTAVLVLLIDARASLIQDALAHSILAYLSALLIPFVLVFLPGPSVLGVMARFEGIGFQSLLVPSLQAVGFWCHWLSMRARADANRQFKLPTLGLAGSSALLIVLIAAWLLIVLASVARIENLQRDHLESVFKLQARAFSAALESADEATDVLTGMDGQAGVRK